MKKFPLPLHRKNGHLIVLDEAQLKWLQKYYPVMENYIIEKAMGIGKETLRRLRTEHNLIKSEEGKIAIRKRQHRRAAETNERNGCYERKRGHPCSEATMEGNRRRWQEEREGKRENILSRMKRDFPQKYKDLMERKSTSRKELIRKEKLRVVYGLGRKTNLPMVVMCPYTESQRHHRSNALKRGYLLDWDCSEGTIGRYVIYYDKQTLRSEKFERNCEKDGFKIIKDEDENI